MKDHFKQKIDDTRQAYLDALGRLKAGNPTHKDLVDKVDYGFYLPLKQLL